MLEEILMSEDVLYLFLLLILSGLLIIGIVRVIFKCLYALEDYINEQLNK